MADVIITSAINRAFYSDYTQQMQSLPEETLLICFVTTLNNTFETELAQEDKGYENGSEGFNILTPLSRALRVYMFQPWRNYPSILQMLVNHQLHQSTMKGTHLKDTDIAALHVTT